MSSQFFTVLYATFRSVARAGIDRGAPTFDGSREKRISRTGFWI
jgi:hypothetical protein